MRWGLLLLAAPVGGQSLPHLNIDRAGVVAAGLGHAGDFAHQFHVAYSEMVSGACVFSGQPFHCAVSHFGQDSLVPKSNATRVPNCDGCPTGYTLPFDHCRLTPRVVDVGSLVDYPRRHCGQNPITLHECFDDVDFIKRSRVFLFRGTKDTECAPGVVENTAALLAQMQEDPATSNRIVTDQPVGHVLPLAPAHGYDGPGNCLRHVFDAPWMVPGAARPSSWSTFDQTEFMGLVKSGLQSTGWIYVPQRCRKESGDQICKLVVRPDTCAPPTTKAPDVGAFADYAEANAIVILHPCVGGEVDTVLYPHAPDVVAGKLDVYGQLTEDYAQQRAPHMRAIGKMVRRLLGKSDPVAAPPPPPKVKVEEKKKAGGAGFAAGKMPTLKIDTRPGHVLTAGCSNTADFAHQLHVAFSALISGSCIFSGMPYNCAITRFPQDYMVPKTNATAAGIHCANCDANGTLIYDHCKNHPHWVDVSLLQQYAETAPNVDDPRVHLTSARVFSFGPTHDRCYQPPAMANVANFHLKYAKDASQVKLVDDQPFPHTLPTNSTPYFNDHFNFTGAGYDGPGECLRHVIGDGQRLYPGPTKYDSSLWKRINATEFVFDLGVGMKPSAWLFVPPQCENGTCSLLILPGGCDAFQDSSPPGSGGSDSDFARYGVENGMVILKPCQGGPIDAARFPNNHENLRGMVDVYGQISADYATQTGGQMAPIGRMIKRLMGVA
eukprot:Hpha_TRINITY_DN1178_c0_g1::TRINITY_DN1178_c0_g1_i1::g.113135::m.113135